MVTYGDTLPVVSADCVNDMRTSFPPLLPLSVYLKHLVGPVYACFTLAVPPVEFSSSPMPQPNLAKVGIDRGRAADTNAHRGARRIHEGARGAVAVHVEGALQTLRVVDRARRIASDPASLRIDQVRIGGAEARVTGDDRPRAARAGGGHVAARAGAAGVSARSGRISAGERSAAGRGIAAGGGVVFGSPCAAIPEQAVATTKKDASKPSRKVRFIRASLRK